MEATLHALGEIMLRAVPTFLFIIFLHFYLKAVFFKPLGLVRRKRYEATAGARKRAEESLERASAKAAEYEAALRAAKAVVYDTQEKLHRELQEQQAAELHAARQQVEAAVKQAQAGLAQELEAAKAGLAPASEQLANQIVESILRRSAA